MIGFGARALTAGIHWALGCVMFGILALPLTASAQTLGPGGAVPGQYPSIPNAPTGQTPNVPGPTDNQTPALPERPSDEFTREFDPIQELSQRAPSNFAARALGNAPNTILGMSVGLSRSIVADLDSAATHAITLSSLQTGIYGQTRKRRTTLNFDYGLRLNREGGTTGRPINVSNQFGFSMAHRLSRRLSLQFQDSFSSAVNDFPATLSPGIGYFAVESFTQFVDVPLQRVTSNVAAVSLAFQDSRRSHFVVSAAYDYRHDEIVQVAQSNNFQVGILGEILVNRWLTLENSYSAHIGRQTQRSGGSSIQRLRLGGLKTRTPNGLEVSFDNGIEIALDQFRQKVHWSVRSSIAKTTEMSTVSLDYHRGLSTLAETSHVINVDTVGLSLNHWMFDRRVNFRTGSQYMRGSTEDGSPVKTASVSATAGVALQSHLLLSANYAFVSQRLGPATIGGPQRRYTAGLSLDYHLRSLLARR